jgi:hypothetical protein
MHVFAYMCVYMYVLVVAMLMESYTSADFSPRRYLLFCARTRECDVCVYVCVCLYVRVYVYVCVLSLWLH